MKKVPLNELKKDLAHWTELAAKGEVVQVTTYNRPYVVLSKSQNAGLYIGKRVGESFSEAPLTEASKGKFLEYLTQDREDLG